MLEDFWLPRREGGKGTEITTLPGGMNLGELEDVKYFEKKLYKALGVPASRLEQQNGGGIVGLGRTTEITRDELKFSKFINRLRNKFATLFDELLRIQLVLKKICTEEEWKEFKEEIWYDFKKDTNFTELKEAELLQNRLAILAIIDPYVGRYYSMAWVRRKVLQMDDDEIDEMQKEMDEEAEANTPTDEQGNPIPVDQNGTPLPPTPGIPPPLPGMPPAPAMPMAPAPGMAPPRPKPAQQMQEEDPLLDRRKQRFINDTLTLAGV
jgi:hypothetical protein